MQRLIAILAFMFSVSLIGWLILAQNEPQKSSQAMSTEPNRKETGRKQDEINHQSKQSPAAVNFLVEVRELSENDFRQIIDQSNLFSVRGTTILMQNLEDYDAKSIAGLFESEIKRLQWGSGADRLRLISAADIYQSAELLPFWQKLALRQSPLYPDEDKVMNAEEPNERTFKVNYEIMTSVRNIGLIAYKDPRAASILEEIASKVQHPHNTYVREEAFAQLLASDKNAALRVLKNLPAEDELRQALKSRLSGWEPTSIA